MKYQHGMDTPISYTVDLLDSDLERWLMSCHVMKISVVYLEHHFRKQDFKVIETKMK